MFKLTAIAAALVALTVGKTPEDINYFSGTAYQAKSAADKLSDLWMMCQKEQDVTWSIPYEYLDDFFKQKMNVSLNRMADEMKPTHKKVLHAQGVVGRVSWENLGNHPYTGLFATGSEKGIIRFSESNFAVPEQYGLTPSFAMKFLRDGKESVNMFGATGFESTGSWNFFHSFFVNHIDVHENELNRNTIGVKMAEAAGHIATTGLGEFSRFYEDGTQIQDYVPPFVLYYVPSDDLYWMFDEEFGDEMPEEDEGDFRDQLKTIPVGMNLFEVWAKNQPESHEDFFEVQIANIRLDSELITSRFGDERLFFQHESMRWDFAFDSSWRDHHERIILPSPEERVELGLFNPDVPLPAFPHDREEAEWLVRESIDEYDCPFAWLLEGLLDD